MTTPDACESSVDAVDVSVVIVSFNTAHLLHEVFACLSAAVGQLTVQVIVVDNASSDGSVALLRSSYPDAVIIANDVNVGFGRANNQALPLLRGRHVLLLNTDAFVAPESLGGSIACMDAHPDCGVLGVRLVSRDGTLQPSCRYFPTPWNSFLARSGLAGYLPRAPMVDDMDWAHDSIRECDWVPGCYYLIRREVITQIGLFDPRFFLYYEEVDHCKRVKQAGWKVLYWPGTNVVHIGGESAKLSGALSKAKQLSSLQIESELLFFRKYFGVRGAVASVALNVLADVVLAAKALLRRQSAKDAWSYLCEVGLIGGVSRRTALGSRPTR